MLSVAPKRKQLEQFLNTVVNFWVPREAGKFLTGSVTFQGSRAIAQAVSHRFPTAEARVRAYVRAGGIWGGQSDIEEDFVPVLRVPLPILIPPIAPHSSSIIQGRYNRPVSGRRTKRTQTHTSPRK
jgi:hypothetical protein